MIGHCILETEATEPAVGQVEVHFFAQPAFRADAEAIAEQQHPHHQLRINRGATRVAVERREMLAEIGEIEETINAAKQMIRGNVRVEVEGMNQSVLVAAVLSHHAATYLHVRAHHKTKKIVAAFKSITTNRPTAEVRRATKQSLNA